jgi:hypothetical protein
MMNTNGNHRVDEFVAALAAYIARSETQNDLRWSVVLEDLKMLREEVANIAAAIADQHNRRDE